MHSKLALYSAAAAIAAPLLAEAAPLRALPRQSGQKFVVAHHIVGNDASYTVDTWASDISLAVANGIDGFALNVGNDPFTNTQVSNAFQAATNANNGFKLFFSFDMSSFPCTAASDAQALISLTQQFITQPNYFQFDGAPYVSTFSGESCTFGQSGDVTTDDSALNAAWETYVGGVGQAIHFAPSFFIDPTRFANLSVTNGGFNFNGGFTNTINDQSGSLIATAQNDTVNALTSDGAFVSGLSGKSYMTGVSPTFFTHFSPQTFNKNFVFLMENSVFAARWQQLATTLRDSVDIVQIVTWNDYGESHYVGPNDGDFPTGSEAWVDGFDHTGLLNVVSHFAPFFKTGTEPAITQDLIVLQGRPNPHNAQSSDPVGIPTTADILPDNFYATVFATAPAQVTLTAASGDNVTSNVPAGVSRLVHPLAVGSGMSATMSRSGSQVLSVAANGTFIFDANPTLFNYNAFVVASS